MSNQEQNQIRYTVACVNEFARAKSLSKAQAFLYCPVQSELGLF